MSLGKDRTENTVSNSSSTVALFSNGSGTVACLQICCLAKGLFAKPFHNNGCLRWLHIYGCQQAWKMFIGYSPWRIFTTNPNIMALICN
jgi:hypothetical protein